MSSNSRLSILIGHTYVIGIYLLLFIAIIFVSVIWFLNYFVGSIIIRKRLPLQRLFRFLVNYYRKFEIFLLFETFVVIAMSANFRVWSYKYTFVILIFLQAKYSMYCCCVVHTNLYPTGLFYIIISGVIVIIC